MVSFSFLASFFTVVFAHFVHGEFISTDYDAYNDGVLGHRPNHTFHSSSESSPVLQVNIWNESRVSKTGSHIFLRHDGLSDAYMSSPLVLDARDLTAVYMNRSFDNVFGTRVQENLGKKYLTFWAGEKGDGIGNGFGYAYDENYRLVYTVSADIKSHGDLHEFAFTGNGTALVTGVDQVTVDTSKWEKWRGQKRFPILDALFQEIDLETNEVLFSWRALDHIDPTDSYERLARNWDAFHMNSIQKTEAGNFLISIRHTNSILLIDGKTGEIIWTLGGKRNVFEELSPSNDTEALAPVLSMGWQHHARFVPNTNDTEMTFFDNHVKDTTTHGTCRPGSCSRGLHVRIDDTVSPPTVQLLHEYLHPSQLQAQSQGSIQALLGNVTADTSTTTTALDHVFVGWGRCPSFTEHDAATGETLLDVQFSPWHSSKIADALDNYRAYRMDWHATPYWKPAMALMENRKGHGALDIFVSWNGATEVRQWVVRGVVVRKTTGPGRFSIKVNGDGEVLARSKRTGFETKLTVDKPGLWYLWAEALDKKGTIIGKTEIVNFEEGNVTVLPFQDSGYDEEDYDEYDDSNRPMITFTWPLLGGIVGAVVGVAVAAKGCQLLWQHALHKYELVFDDDIDLGSDLDADSDVDMESVLGLDLFSDEFGPDGPEPWQDYGRRPGLRKP